MTTDVGNIERGGKTCMWICCCFVFCFLVCLFVCFFWIQFVWFLFLPQVCVQLTTNGWICKWLGKLQWNQCVTYKIRHGLPGHPLPFPVPWMHMWAVASHTHIKWDLRSEMKGLAFHILPVTFRQPHTQVKLTSSKSFWSTDLKCVQSLSPSVTWQNSRAGSECESLPELGGCRACQDGITT